MPEHRNRDVQEALTNAFMSNLMWLFEQADTIGLYHLADDEPRFTFAMSVKYGKITSLTAKRTVTETVGFRVTPDRFDT